MVNHYSLTQLFYGSFQMILLLYLVKWIFKCPAVELSLKFKHGHMGSMKFCLECNIHRQHCVNVLLLDFLKILTEVYTYIALLKV